MKKAIKMSEEILGISKKIILINKTPLASNENLREKLSLEIQLIMEKYNVYDLELLSTVTETILDNLNLIKAYNMQYVIEHDLMVACASKNK